MCDRDDKDLIATQLINNVAWKTVQYASPNLVMFRAIVDDWKSQWLVLNCIERGSDCREKLSSEPARCSVVPTRRGARVRLCSFEQS